MGKTEKSMFVTRAFLNTVIERFRKSHNKVIRQNAALVRNSNQIVSAKNHYLKHRLPFLKDRENYREKLSEELVELRRLKSILENIVGHLKLGDLGQSDNGKPRFLMKLTNHQHLRLKGLLNNNHVRCMRPPEGKVPAYLTGAEKQKLAAILKSPLSWKGDRLKLKNDKPLYD